MSPHRHDGNQVTRQPSRGGDRGEAAIEYLMIAGMLLVSLTASAGVLIPVLRWLVAAMVAELAVRPTSIQP